MGHVVCRPALAWLSIAACGELRCGSAAVAAVAARHPRMPVRLGDLLARGRLWLRRHRGVASVATASLVVLVGLGGVAVARIGAERDRAEAALQTAEAALATAEEDRKLAERRADEAQRAQAQADASADQLRLQQARATVASDPAAAIHELAALGPTADNDRPARLLALAAVAHGLPERTLAGPRSAVIDVHSLADGSFVACEHSGQLWRWAQGAAQGEVIATDGELVSSQDGMHWARVTREAIELHRTGAEMRRIAITLARAPMWYRWRFDAAGRTLVGHSMLEVPAVVIDLGAGAVAAVPGPGAPALVAASKQHTPSPDGRIIAAVHERERLVVWNREDGSVRSVRLPAPFTFESIEFADDARTIVVRCEGDRLLVWRDDGTSRVVDARWATFAGEALVLLASADKGLKLWAEPIAGGPALWSRSMNDEFPASRAWRPFMAGEHGLARVQFAGRWEVFDVRTGATRYARAGNYDEPLVLGHGEQILLTAPGEDSVHRLQLLDLSRSPWTPLAPLATPGGIVRTAISANARFAVRQGLKSRLVERLDLTRNIAEPLPAGCGAWTSDPLLLTVGDDGRVLLVDNQHHACLWSGDVTYPLPVSQGFVSGMALAPDGAGFAIALADNTLSTWDRPDAQPRRGAGTQLEYSPDGEYMVVLADPEATIVPRSGAPMALPKLGDAHTLRFAISPDSRFIALHHPSAGAVHLVYARDGKTVRTCLLYTSDAADE